MIASTLLASVIVPAYNATSTLPACLGALQKQTVPRSSYEIIVVDDGSTDETAEVARSFGIRLVSQTNTGPAAARNQGARLAHAPILLFTDADCTPAPNWIAQMLLAFEDPHVIGAKGVYDTRQREVVARFVQLEYEDRYDRMRDLDQIDFIDTYAAGYQRDIFLQMGGFDTTFPTASVEDQEFSFRLAKTGQRLVFAPQARVFHLHDRTMAEYFRRKYWIGYWKVRVMRAYPDKLIHDSHTPQILKLQMGLAALGGLLILSGIFEWQLIVVGLVAWVLLLLSSLPFMIKIGRWDPQVILVASILLFARAWALGLGFLFGLFGYY
ncbi:MAG: glycosyltransferase [Chloroflexi bacterium]|nr:glycosyltransferase [Chloroflexota bacterium]